MRTPLRIRARLRARRPVAVRRHTGRLTTRFLVLCGGDAIAFVVYLLVAEALKNVFIFGSFLREHLGPALTANPADSWYFAGALFCALFITGSYSRHRALNRSVRLLSSAALASLIIFIALPPRVGLGPATLFFAFTAVLTWAVLLAERRMTDRFLRDVWPRNRGTAPALFVRTGHASDAKVEYALLAAGGDYRRAGYLWAGDSTDVAAEGPELGTLDDLDLIIDEHHIEAVVVCGDLPPSVISDIVDASLAAGSQIIYPAQVVRIPGVRPRLVWHHDQPFFELGAPVLKATALITKRVVDVIGSIIGLGIFLPVFAGVAAAIKLDSPGPIFFPQDRAGLGGRRFRMIKFRTMRRDADSEKSDLSHLNHTGDPRLFKIPGDPRITPLGHFLRRWSIDELPQLWNVFVGEMSLVGPRPFFEADFPAYEDHHFRRLDAKPGITGLWQVSGGSKILNFEDVVFLDRQYIEQWSFWLDVSILFRTIPAILGRGDLY